MRGGASERFWAKVELDSDSGCWLWSGATTSGYGRFWFDGRLVLAHRFAYQLLVEEIPDGKQIDHLCRVSRCVNPSHMETVTPQQNVRRSSSPASANARRSACVAGHPFNLTNTYVTPDGRRQCRICGVARSRDHQTRKAESVANH